MDYIHVWKIDTGELIKRMKISFASELSILGANLVVLGRDESVLDIFVNVKRAPNCI